MNKIKLALLALLVILVSAINIKRCVRDRKEEQSITNTITALNDSITTWRNKYNQQVAKIGIIESENFLKIKSKDSTINSLQDLVKEYKRKIKDGGSAAVIITETNIDTVIQVIKEGDTVYIDYEDQWITLQGQIIKDSLGFRLLVNNEFHLVYGKEGKKKYAELTNLNPYTSTKDIRVYFDTPKEKRFSVGLNIGLSTGYDILHNSLYLGVGIGVGLNFKF